MYVSDVIEVVCVCVYVCVDLLFVFLSKAVNKSMTHLKINGVSGLGSEIFLEQAGMYNLN